MKGYSLQHWSMSVAAILAGVSILPAYSPQPEPWFALAGWVMFLLVLSHSSGWRQFAARGFLFGAGLYGVGLYWLFVVADYVPVTFTPIINLINIGIVLINCLYPAIIAVVVIFFKKSSTCLFLVAMPFLWVIGEWLRSWVLTGLPLYQLGHAFIETPLAGFAPLGGELAVTLASAAVASGIAGMILCHPGWHKVLSGIVALIIMSSGWFFQQIAWTTPNSTIAVRTLHGMPDQQRKTKHYYVVDTIKEYLDRSESQPLANIVIWPESSIAIGLHEVYHHLQNDAGKLGDKGSNILVGGYLRSGLNSYNTFFLASDPNTHYFKRHLIPFGEYIPQWPVIDWSQWLPNVENSDLHPGTKNQPLITIDTAQIAPILCYELLFPNELRFQWPDANLLVFASDLNWFKDTWGIHQLFQLSRLRAIESGKWLVSSTSYGMTAIVDDRGNLIKGITSGNPEKWLDASVTLRSGSTPYTRYGHDPVLLIAFSGIFLLVIFSIYSTGQAKRKDYPRRFPDG